MYRLCLDHFKYQGRKKIMTLTVIGDSSMGRKSTTLPTSRRSAVPSANGSLPHTFRSVSQYGDYAGQDSMFHSKLLCFLSL